jgi:pilus assembly protein CpaF
MSLLRRISPGGGDGKQGPGGSSSGGQGGGDQPARRVPPPENRPSGGQGGAAPNRGNDSTYMDLKVRVQNKLLNEMDQSMDVSRKAEIRNHIEELFNAILAEESMVLSRAERQRLFDSIVAEILGFGPLEPLLADDTITEIMVNGPKNIFVERKGNLVRANVAFEGDEHVMRIIDRIVSPLGRRVDESSPIVDARLPDGSRVNAIIRPLALCGPTITIRKFSKKPLTVEDLIRFGSLTPEIAEFLRACVIGRLNMVVAGGTGSGKTTLLNVLSSFIPASERRNCNCGRNM